MAHSEPHPTQTRDPQQQQQKHPEKRRRIGKDTTSHGPTLEVALVDVDLVVFGRFEIKAWFPSPYVIDQLEYRQATATAHPHPTSQPKPIGDDGGHNKKPATPCLKRLSNGRFQKKKNKKKRKIDPAPPNNTLPTSPSNSTTPSLQEHINHHDENHQKIRSRSPSQDSLSSLASSSSSPCSPHSDLLPPNHLQLPVPPNHLYPSPQSHPSSLTSDRGGKIQPSQTSSTHHLSQPSPPSALKLYVCDGCLRYLFSADAYLQHKMRCGVTHPPGRKVYQSGNLIIREVDGSSAKLYCQCLCLFGKLFIDHKYIFFDVESFNFYILTNVEEDAGTGSVRETIVGFFSKEKISYDGYNLACIVTLPPYQKKGYGTLLIEFSYELDRFEADREAGHIMRRSAQKMMLGTPERPLSTMGARGYLRFWTAVLVRFFRTLFTPPPPRLPAGQKKRAEGHHKGASKMVQAAAADGAEPAIEITLEEISCSTRIRPDDVAFALISSGLATRKSSPKAAVSAAAADDDDEEEDGSTLDSQTETFVITPHLVEHVARTIKVKSAILDPRHVLLHRNNQYPSSDDSDPQSPDTSPPPPPAPPLLIHPSSPVLSEPHHRPRHRSSATATAAKSSSLARTAAHHKPAKP
ncbi:hypothetical protein PCANC_20157 [Puccinia coronata f. sp. avenae]|uniref:histone acetyltransferase n=1 Tax=Puccinia coronata f. sp. avenae TaxID=200324 RepID=A0A2N5SUH8_9BASI|nr:hypothetical protein PCANC_20157 [Puccinia coronata f. sp. avenae]